MLYLHFVPEPLQRLVLSEMGSKVGTGVFPIILIKQSFSSVPILQNHLSLLAVCQKDTRVTSHATVILLNTDDSRCGHKSTNEALYLLETERLHYRLDILGWSVQ